MSDSIRDLPHGCIVDYVNDELSPTDMSRIQKLKTTDPMAQLFFDIIDQTSSSATISSPPGNTQSLSTNFTQTDDILLKIFSGNATSDDNQHFIDALLFAPVFYQRLLARLPQVTAGVVMAETLDLAEEEMLTDEKILSERILKKSHSNGTSGALTLAAADFKVKVGGWLDWLAGHPGLSAAGVAILLMIFLMPAAIQTLKPDPFAQYVYDDKVPYEYRAIIFRAPGDQQAPLSDFGRFQQQFQAAMADYVMRRYEDATTRLDALQPLVALLTREGASHETEQAIRDYYFYSGVSYLAMARSEKFSTDKETATSLLLRARKQLELAEKLSASENISEDGRESFFIAMSAGFVGDRQAAVERLMQIKPENQYFEDSQRLLDVWRNEG